MNVLKESSVKDEYLIAEFIKKLLPDLENNSKTLVDVGGNSDAIFSSFFKDYKKLIIEPQSELCKDLSKIYSDDLIINKGCGNKKDKLKLYLSKPGGSSEVATFNTNNDPWLNEIRGDQYIEVEVDTLTNILDENNFDKEITILKIDAESWDPKIIEGIDFNKYKPQIIVTEDYYWEPENLDKNFTCLKRMDMFY